MKDQAIEWKTERIYFNQLLTRSGLLPESENCWLNFSEKRCFKICLLQQGGNEKATYGSAILENLSKDLTRKHGKGFSRSNLNYKRLFYKRYPICEEVPHKLSWTHFCELVKIVDPLERSFYEKQSIAENWKGFAFIGRQYRITLGNRHHYVDLVFYHRILKCFVLIDLKKEEASYQDVGQMNMYLGYFEKEENTQGDNPPIGIVLAKEKDDLLIQYAMHHISSQLFVNKYQLYLPNKQDLQKIIAMELNRK
ncbi:MAG: PDDEXK nuclease domain-containing protein [Bacteroidia bacterium]|nr:PDDEXK nuclease domain-containing protein [Bacteroidia bacterium]